MEEHIATGQCQPGRRLDAQEIAGAFGVSRTPVREALFQLAVMGLVEIRPRRSAIVAEKGARDAKDSDACYKLNEIFHHSLYLPVQPYFNVHGPWLPHGNLLVRYCSASASVAA